MLSTQLRTLTRPVRSINAQTPLKFVNTSMHGVSDPVMREAFELFGLPKYTPVVAQQKPDPEFPTVKFPNPEEKGTRVSACVLGSILTSTRPIRQVL